MGKEKRDKNIVVMVSQSMYKKFLASCEAEYLTMSEYLRSCIREKIKEDKENSWQSQQMWYNKRIVISLTMLTNSKTSESQQMWEFNCKANKSWYNKRKLKKGVEN